MVQRKKGGNVEFSKCQIIVFMFITREIMINKDNLYLQILPNRQNYVTKSKALGIL